MQHIKLLALDVDGVLTDGTLWFGAQGEELKRFHIHDGLGLKRLQKTGITIAIISGRFSLGVSRRMEELGISHIYQDCDDKLEIFKNLIKELAITPEEAAYVGDDLPDLPVLKVVGLSIAVANACPEVLAIAHWKTTKEGGKGAVREICDRLLALHN